MNTSITSPAGPVGGHRTRQSSDALAPDVETLIAGWETARTMAKQAEAAHEAAVEMARRSAALAEELGIACDSAAWRASDADATTSRALARIGPKERGGWRYEGREEDGLWGVVRTRVGGAEDARPVVAEAVVAIDEESA